MYITRSAFSWIQVLGAREAACTHGDGTTAAAVGGSVSFVGKGLFVGQHCSYGLNVYMLEYTADRRYRRSMLH